MTAPNSVSTGTAPLPCPLCQSANVAEGICYVNEFTPNEPAARCVDCGCRATMKAWQSRHAAQGSWMPIDGDTPFDEKVLLGWWREWPERRWEQALGLAGSKKGGWLHGQATHWQRLLSPPGAAPQPPAAGYAERNAVIEECAKAAEALKEEFLSTQYAANQPFGSICERFACDHAAAAIRALSLPSTQRATEAPVSGPKQHGWPVGTRVCDCVTGEIEPGACHCERASGGK